MRTYKLTLAYEGTNYVGWQRQANGASVQQLVEEAFAPLVDGVAPTVAGAGRTDAGVHALGQVASVNAEIDLSPQAVQRALNVRLPADIRVLHVEDATPGFHARFHAVRKQYRYRMITASVLSPFDRWYVWHAPGRRNVDVMREAAAVLVGKHDFASFQARGASVAATIRTVHDVNLASEGDEIRLTIEGDGFLRHMVRIVMGTLADLGLAGRTSDPAAAMCAILDARNRRAAGPTAPASGLTLLRVAYRKP